MRIEVSDSKDKFQNVIKVAPVSDMEKNNRVRHNTQFETLF